MVLKAMVTKEKDKNEQYLIQKKYSISEGQYGVWENKGDSLIFVPKGSAVYVSRVVNRIDTGEKFLDLYFFDAQGCKVEITFPRKELTEQGIMALLGFGVQVLKQDARALIASIMNQEQDAPCILQHEALGFSKYDNHTVFLGQKAIAVNSKYAGRLQIGEKGSYEAWKEMVENEVIGNIPMEFILAVGGCGLLVDYLKEKVQVENVVVSMVGESSTGKSTAGLFLVSCGASPSFQGDSLVMNFADTVNALMATIQSSYPVLIDEGSLCRYNPTSLLYSLAMGQEKKRLNKDLERSESGHFSTAIAITSEKSMIGISDENSGLLVRVLEIENVVWTKDAQSADLIKNTIVNNHGWLIPQIAETILLMEEQYGQEEILSGYWEWYEYFVQSAKEQGFYNSFTERVCKQYALILSSASLIEIAMDIKLNTDEIVSFIETHSLVREMNCADIGSRAIIYLMQYITKYYSQFVQDRDGDFVPNKCLGRIKNLKNATMKNNMTCTKMLLIADETLEDILREGRFPDKRVVLKHWKMEGILKCEIDRYVSDVVIVGNMPVKGYRIYLPEIGEENRK